MTFNHLLHVYNSNNSNNNNNNNNYNNSNNNNNNNTDIILGKNLKEQQNFWIVFFSKIHITFTFVWQSLFNNNNNNNNNFI